ncbi:HNH endonuclease [Halomonas sp. I5-271120]|uniref:HNH endonuclease n=1 Tax=Halomonas sp. I5-271120 TaxID=3061632 RepID=UPI002715462C|nr:HNH endonuclease [Halomonas sp. I5-271120]
MSSKRKRQRAAEAARSRNITRAKRATGGGYNFFRLMEILAERRVASHIFAAKDLEGLQTFQEIGSHHGLTSAGIGSLQEAASGDVDEYPALGYLWVYEPEDLIDLTLEEVQIVWSHRNKLCGSREAAAEALAIIEVDNGTVETYQGWLSYMDFDEVRELAPEVDPFGRAPVRELDDGEESSQVDTPAPSILDDSELVFPPLTRMDLAELSLEELKDAWERRPASFASLEAACGALAQLRKQAGIAPETGWRHLMTHGEIAKLAGDLPDQDGEDSALELDRNDIPSPPTPNADELRADKRTRRQQQVVVREGQAGFRQDVLDNYGHRCCVTDCQETLLLEAAHISPYTGPHSNHPANGLCLRVDIHRLFDRYFISIDPDSWRLVVTPRLADESSYRDLDGLRLPRGRIPVSRELVAEHYRRFLDSLPIGSAEPGYI